MALSLSELRQKHCIMKKAASLGRSVSERFVNSDEPRGTAAC